MSFDASATLEPAVSASFVPPPVCRRAATRPEVECHDVDSPRRYELEEFVKCEFLAHFGAHVTQFMPNLLALRTVSGEIRSVVGCRSAARAPLFLETYTREPIEIALARRNGFFVPRARIVEIGSLACRNAAGAVVMVQALVPYLLDAGFSWVVFTGATTVMNVFRHLGLSPQALCPADPQLLGAARYAWGTYYDHAPHVMAGRIIDGAAAAAPRDRMRELAQ